MSEEAPSQETGVEVAFDWNGRTLSGSLHVPRGDGPFPTVLMLQGSGPADRDGDGYFVPIREAFLSRGVATYSFDKPGCGTSTGDWREHALGDRADQAEEALAVLCRNDSVDATRLGVWGQSQGGWLVQMLAARHLDLAFAVANSGPSIGVRLQDLYGCEHTMRAAGHPEAEIDAALEFMGRLHGAAAAGHDLPTVEAEIVSAARSMPWYRYSTEIDAAEWGLMCSFVQEDYQPLVALAEITCPFLAIFGGRDVLVPAWRGAEETGAALNRAGNTDATVVVFPDGNHRIGDSATGAFVSGYLDLLGDWVEQRVRR